MVSIMNQCCWFSLELLHFELTDYALSSFIIQAVKYVQDGVVFRKAYT